MENCKFKIGDLVIQKGKKIPVMEVKGKTLKAVLGYKPINDEYTCFWEDINGPNWVSFKESDLEIYKSNNKI
jgi:uncharacterized protein YodC (DUF2158 family)